MLVAFLGRDPIKPPIEYVRYAGSSEGLLAHRASEGTVCAREQARAWALREIWIETNVQRKVARSKLSRTDLYGMIAFVRNRVFVTGKTTHHPSTQSLADLFHKVDSDSGWFPGKKVLVLHRLAPNQFSEVLSEKLLLMQHLR